MDCVCYYVDAVGEVGDFAVCVGAEGGVDGGGVVCLAVAWGWSVCARMEPWDGRLTFGAGVFDRGEI